VFVVEGSTGGLWNKIFIWIFRSNGIFSLFWRPQLNHWKTPPCAKVWQQSCSWPLKLMTSQAIQVMWICTGSLHSRHLEERTGRARETREGRGSSCLPCTLRAVIGQFRSEWVNFVTLTFWIWDWNPSVLPFKKTLSGRTFTWCSLISRILHNEIGFFVNFFLGHYH